MKQRTVLAPVVDSDFSKDGKLSYWKQIVPKREIEYTTKGGKRAKLNFDDAYLSNLAKSFNDKVLGSTPFVLADVDNKHTMDPERFRGEITEVRFANPGEDPGLYGKITFPSKSAAKAVVMNPNLGVSARIREGLPTNDGSTVPCAMIHVLGTMDPQIPNMAPWVPAVDLSFDPNDNILDLSMEHPVAKKDDKGKTGEVVVPDIDAVTDADIDKMTGEELEAFLQKYADADTLAQLAELEDDELEDDASTEVVDDNNVDPETVPKVTTEKELEPALSAKDLNDIALANGVAAAAQARADEALRRMADAEWKQWRTAQMDAGVPAHTLDLAEPVLNRPESMTIDLSNEEGDDLDVGAIVRQLVEGYKGYVDLSTEQGHSGVIGDENDPDAAALAAWPA